MGSNWINSSFDSSFGSKNQNQYIEYMAMKLKMLAEEGKEEEKEKPELIKRIMEILTSYKKEKLEEELAKKGRPLDEEAYEDLFKTLEKRSIEQLKSMLETLTNEQQEEIKPQDESNQTKGKDEGREPGE